MNSQERLYIELDSIKVLIDPKDWEYYHLEGLENFIYHIENIKCDKTKALTIQEIEDYMTLLLAKFNSGSSKYNNGKELMFHIWPIFVTYKHEVGFILKPNHFINASVTILLFIVVRLWLSDWVSITICMAILTIWLFYSNYKVKSKKYF